MRTRAVKGRAINRQPRLKVIPRCWAGPFTGKEQDIVTRRFRLLTGLSGITIAAVIGVGTIGPASAAPLPTAQSGYAAPAAPSAGADAAAVATGSQSCSLVRADLNAFAQRAAARGLSQVGCWQADPASAGPSTERSLVGQKLPPISAGPRAATTASCSVLSGSTWDLLRTSACLNAGLTYTVFDLDTGVVNGTAQFTVTQAIDANAASTDWAESDTLTLVSEFGTAVDLSAAWTTGCSTPCSPASASPWDGPQPLAPGDTLSGETSFSDPGLSRAAPGPDAMNESYTLDVTQPAVLPAAPLTWSSPTVRCDNVLRVAPAGCVFPDATPQYVVPISQYGAAAAMIQWAQQNLTGAWGSPAAPLHRLGIPAQTQMNRRVICRRGWRRNPAISTDSCDEYPFASTKESGALHGVTSGTQCAQVEAVRDPAVPATAPLAQQWPSVRVIGTFAATAACVRGHIPQTLNEDVGRIGLATLTRLARLLPGDAYTVLVTP
jgi:hypothetical protein